VSSIFMSNFGQQGFTAVHRGSQGFAGLGFLRSPKKEEIWE